MANFHKVYMSLETLLLECKGCGRRASISKAESKRHIHQGNMQAVNSVTFRCTKCGSKEARGWIPRTQDHIDMFLVGDPPHPNMEQCVV